MSGIAFKKTSALLATTALITSALSATLAMGYVAHAQDADQPAEEPEVITIRGVFIPEERRDTSEISAIVDADDFSARGDGDAAVALARVTGLSISDDGFVFARGLNERYSSATLNGSPLPSPAPLRRVTPLDLFPTSVLESALAQKTYSPQYSAEFGGAVIDLRTRLLPDEPFFSLSLSAGYDTETTFDRGLLYDGGDEDWTGFDDGERNRPPELNAIRGVSRVNDLSGAEREAVGESLNNDASLWVIQSDDIDADGSISFSAGERFDVSPSLSIGIIAAGGYSNEWQTRRGIRGQSSSNADGLFELRRRERFSTQNEIGLNGLLTVGFDILENHELSFTALGVRQTEKEARTIIGPTIEDLDRNSREENLEWFENQVWTTQVNGTHFFPSLGDLEVAWRGSYSEALRDAPYQRFAEYTQLDDGTFRYDGESSANSTTFSFVGDDTTDFAVDLTLPFAFGGIEGELIGGYSYTESDRIGEQQIYRYSAVTDPNLLVQRIDLIFSDANIGSSTGASTPVLNDTAVGQEFPEAYAATLETDAGYLGVDAQITDSLRAAVGVRYEDAIEAVQIFPFVDDVTGSVVVPINEDYLLPAATLTWTFAENMQLRLGYSNTITRPQFRELAPAPFVNTETDEIFFGNPFLVDTEITNYDARFEWYFARDQFFTFGAFYKDLENPIEEYGVQVGGNDSSQTTFINAPAATLYGFEVEFERLFEMGDMFENVGWIQPYTGVVRANYTWSDSELEVDDTTLARRPTNVTLRETTIDQDGDGDIDGDDLILANLDTSTLVSDIIADGRQLLGQSEHLFNLQLGYENYDARSRAFFLVNFASERIRTQENGRQLPAVIEEPPTSLNFVYSREFTAMNSDVEFGFRATNLLGDDYEAFQEEGDVRVPVDTYELGQTFTLSLRFRR